jgi:hypothetical protein
VTSIARSRVLGVLTVSAALAATALATAPVAEAGPPGHWTRLTTSSGVRTYTEPSLVRLGSKLEVVWKQSDSLSDSVHTRGISTAGKAESTTHTVVSGWKSIVDDPSAFAEHGRLVVAFAGEHTASMSDFPGGAIGYATSSDAATWSLGPAALTISKNASGANGMAAVDGGGAPVVAFAQNPAPGLTYNRGIPPASSDSLTKPSGGTAMAPALARDTKTGDVWASWYDTSGTHNGVWYQRIYPVGPLRHAVGSSTAAGSVAPAGAIAMTSRPGGGVYLAYSVGATPSSITKIRILKATTTGSSYHDITAPNGRMVALAPGTGGRIWLAWYQSTSGKVLAVRSNKSVSKFGSVVSAAGPNTKLGYGVDQVAIEGSKGPLDVVVTADVPNKGYQALYHTQLYAPLSVTLSKASVKSSTGGSVTVTVTEAGSPLAGVSVSFAGATVHTNSRGKATLTVKPHAAKGKKTVTVSLTYYVTKRVTVRVT